jgi:hypothetical protein
VYDSRIGLGDREEVWMLVGLSSRRSRKTPCRVDLRSCWSRECAFNPAWSGYYCDRDDRVDLIGGENIAIILSVT